MTLNQVYQASWPFVGLFIARIPIRYALKGLLPPLPFMVFIVILGIAVYLENAG